MWTVANLKILPCSFVFFFGPGGVLGWFRNYLQMSEEQRKNFQFFIPQLLLPWSQKTSARRMRYKGYFGNGVRTTAFDHIAHEMIS